MLARITLIFDALELIADRLPCVHRLIVEVILITLAVVGAISLLQKHS